METIKINPEECEIFGNIISNKHGYLEDKNDFESHKCMVSLNNVKLMNGNLTMYIHLN